MLTWNGLSSILCHDDSYNHECVLYTDTSGHFYKQFTAVICDYCIMKLAMQFPGYYVAMMITILNGFITLTWTFIFDKSKHSRDGQISLLQYNTTVIYSHKLFKTCSTGVSAAAHLQV